MKRCERFVGSLMREPCCQSRIVPGPGTDRAVDRVQDLHPQGEIVWHVIYHMIWFLITLHAQACRRNRYALCSMRAMMSA